MKLSRLLREAHLPKPVPQFAITDDRARLVAQVDFAYPARRIAIQAEGYRWHGGRRRFVEDLRTRNRLQELGWRVLHVTWDDLDVNGAALLAPLSTWLRSA